MNIKGEINLSENIKKLTEKEKVRDKISVWLGASNHVAVIHTVKEIVGNSIDEINKGRGNKIKITRHNEKTLTIEDNAQGLPIEGKNNEGVDNYLLLFETLFAGSKYENGISNSDYTVGVNGVFNTVLAFSSQDVTFEVARPNGNIYSISYNKGNRVKELKTIGKSDITYTKITYALDDDIFEDNSFTFKELCEIASQQASLIVGEIEVFDEEHSESKVFKYENGIKDLLGELNESKRSLVDVIEFEKTVSHTLQKESKDLTDDMKIKVVINYTKEDEDNVQIEFLNGSNLIHHGTIYDGFIGGLRNIVNKYLRDNNLYAKDEKQITKEDIITGLNYIIDFKSYFPVFASQTKFASYVKYYDETMKNVLTSFFSHYSIENKEKMNILCNQILANKKSRESAERTRINVKKKLEKTIGSFEKIDGLVECRSKNPKERELYIVEGESAKGSIVAGRDSKTQAVYAIRGKTLSTRKASVNQIFSNDVILEIYRMLGCGVELKDKKNKSLAPFDISKLQYDKIIIASDSDVDGKSIATLLITMFDTLSPTLLKEGKIYKAESPLYELIDVKGDKIYYAYSDEERDIAISEMPQLEVSRNKGLGEVDKETIYDTMMNKDTRHIIQYTVTDNENADKFLDIFMGKDVEIRRNYIEKHFDEYEFDI